MGEFVKLLIWAVVFASLGAGLTYVATMRAVDQWRAQRRQHPSNETWTPEQRDLMEQRSKDFMP